MASKAALSGIDPLKDLLGDVIARLEALEAKTGVSPSANSIPKSSTHVLGTVPHGGKY